MLLVISKRRMSESKNGKEVSAASSTECPVCYETFQSPKVLRRTLSCGHTFCHDCLVKCLLASRDNGRFQSSLTCPVCRFVTLLCRNRSSWPSKALPDASSLELTLSASSLPLTTSNTLVVPGHFLMPLHGHSIHPNVCGCPSMNSVVHPSGLERESHIFTITRCGMPLIEENYDVVPQDRDVEAPGQGVSRRSLMGCFKSPIILAIFLVSAVAVLGALLPWLLVTKRNG